MESGFPAAEIEGGVCKEEEKCRHAEVVDDGAGIDQPASEVGQVLLDGDVVEKRHGLESLTGDVGDKAEEKEHDEDGNRDDAGDNLIGTQRGGEAADGEEEGSDQHQDGKGANDMPSLCVLIFYSS